MRILIMTHLFAPSIGGIETMSLLLARAFVAAGHEVRVVTATPSSDPRHDHGLTVLRRPAPAALLKAATWCDVCFHNNISLAFAWPVLLLGKPWVVTSQTWIARDDRSLGWREHLKRTLLRCAHSVAISRAITRSLPVRSQLIPNCYDSDLFHAEPEQPAGRAGDLIFVGRLVSDKGADLALEALQRLRKRGLSPNLTIIGDGPERAKLEAQVLSLNMETQVNFAGPKQGEALASEFRRHRIQLVPSRWAEPFGVVALEGAACGCLVLGSQEGGLIDAIGPCGATFPNGDADGLADLIERALSGGLSICVAARDAHLQIHQPAAVAARYLDVFTSLQT